MIMRAPWYITNEQIRNEANIKTVKEIIKDRSKATVQKIQQYENPLARQPGAIKAQHNSDTHISIVNQTANN